MRYIDFLELYDYFQPVYDITEERSGYWKQFIPTKDFQDLLRLFLNSLETKDPSNKKSIWVRGSYGTGKSHSAGVIKHLLWDPVDEIEDFIERLNDVQIKERLKRFRERNRVFPITLKASTGVYDSKTMSLTIERAVKDALRRENIEISVKSEFEKYIEYIESDEETINWDKIIDSNTELRALVNNVDGLLKMLRDGDVEVLKKLESSSPFALPFKSIENWLVDIVEELKNRRICNSIAIYWDEFTSLLEKDRSSEILSVLQNIAEKCFYNDIFLFIISHRHPQQVQLDREDYRKVLDRFQSKEYTMENITTFHIISNVIRKKDRERWEKLREEVLIRNNKFNNLIWKLSESEDISTKKALLEVFPIHPYTAFLATGISRFIGSTERSIFKFLYDEEKGFLKFIREYPSEEEYFLTPDYLWDFFLEDFSGSPSEKVSSVIEKYKIFIKEIEKKGEPYVAIFKGILLLNILKSYIEIGGVSSGNPYLPSEENIRAMFVGTRYEKYLDEVLRYIDERGYIPRTPDGLFLVSLVNLPPRELEEEIRSLRSDYENITKALKEEQREELLEHLKSNVLRELDVEIYWAGSKDYDLRRKLRNDFTRPYSLHMAVFIAKNKDEILNAESNIKKITEEDEIIKNDVIFVVSEEPLGEENYNRMVEYTARALVSNRHLFREEEDINRNYAEEILNRWINKIESGYVSVFYRDRTYKCMGNILNDYLNKTISPEIFNSGPENIMELRNNINIWTTKNSEKAIEIFIFAASRDDLEDRTKNFPYKNLRDILKSNNGEYIVNKDLNFRENLDLDHPTVKICKEVERKIKGNEGKTFNLGVTLEFLQRPPFGLYSNMLNSSILAFALRPYTGKLYEEGTGRRIDKELMRDKVSAIFRYWKDNKDIEKLNVRLGTPEERELVDILKELFNLKSEENLNKIKWSIREWIKNTGYPIWSIKYLSDSELITEGVTSLMILLVANDKDITQERIRTILTILQRVKTDLKILLNEEKLREGFIRWLSEKGSIEPRDEELDSILSYLYSSMQEEVSLWDEDKVILKLRDWKEINEVDKKEREFISIVGDIFQIQPAANLSGLRDKVRKHINENIGYPLWVFNYTFRNKDIETSLNHIISFIKSEGNLDQDTIKKYIDDLKLNKTLLATNLTSRIAEESISLWLREKTKIEPAVFISYLRKNLKKEVYLWEERDVINILKEFEFIDKLKNIFNLVEIDSLSALKDKIKGWIVNIGCPFWSFNLGSYGEDIGRTIEKLLNFLTSAHNLNPEEFESMATTLSQNMSTFKDIFKEDKGKDLFKTWLKETINLKILEEKDLDEIARRVRVSMPGEDFYFNKDRVENWIRKNIKSLIPEDVRIRIRRRVESSQRDFKELLFRLLDYHPEIYDWLGEFWEEL